MKQFMTDLMLKNNREILRKPESKVFDLFNNIIA